MKDLLSREGVQYSVITYMKKNKYMYMYKKNEKTLMLERLRAGGEGDDGG